MTDNVDAKVRLGGTPRDIIEVEWDGSAGTDAYIRIGALEEDEAREIMARFQRIPQAEQVIPHEGLTMPPMGVTHVLGGEGPAIISMKNGVLIITKSDGTTMATVTSIIRKAAGISFTTKGGVQHVFTFSERPIPALPEPWGQRFPVGSVTQVGA